MILTLTDGLLSVLVAMGLPALGFLYQVVRKLDRLGDRVESHDERLDEHHKSLKEHGEILTDHEKRLSRGGL